MIKRFCDRCGTGMGVVKDDDETYNEIGTWVDGKGKSATNTWEVCDDCAKSFNKWMNDEKI